MIHGWIGGIVVEQFPFFAAQVVGEARRGRCGWFAVIANTVVVIRSVGATREINPRVFLAAARGDTKGCLARMIRQLGPFNLGRIMVVDLALPAFVGGNKLRPGAIVSPGSVDVDNRVIHQGSRMTENRPTW